MKDKIIKHLDRLLDRQNITADELEKLANIHKVICKEDEFSKMLDKLQLLILDKTNSMPYKNSEKDTKAMAFGLNPLDIE